MQTLESKRAAFPANAGRDRWPHRPMAWSVVGLALLLNCFIVSAAEAAVPSIEKVELKTVRGSATTRLAPQDTFFVDVSARDPDGFRDVTVVDASVSYGTLSWFGFPAWQGTTFQWRRTGVPRWRLTASDATGWKLIESLCSVDTLTNSGAPKVVRFAIVPTPIARADSSAWRLNAWIGFSFRSQTGLSMAERVEWVPLDSLGRFSPGGAGSSDLPLASPTTGALSARLVTNTPTTLGGSASAFVGQSNPASRFGGGAADTLLRWTLQDPSGTHSGSLDSLDATLSGTIAANEDTAARAVTLRLSLSLPAAKPAQDYLSGLRLTARTASGATDSSFQLPLSATVLSTDVAASSATAEVEPHVVVAGTTAQAMVAQLALSVNAPATGVNRVRVALPSGWRNPRVASVTNSLGSPVSFHDASGGGSAIAALHTTVGTGTLLLSFTSDVPTLADAAGGNFPVFFDDTTTVVPEQVAVEGNVDATGGAGWRVSVTAAAIARILILPDSLELAVGDTATLSAMATDAFGNLRSDPIAWSESGGAGSVDATGRYLGIAAGTSRVVARVGAIADTARIDVIDPLAAIQIGQQNVPLANLLPGHPALEVARVRLVNPGARADTVEDLELTDLSRGAGTPDQIARSWEAFELRDSLGGFITTGELSAGHVQFTRLGLPLPSSGGLTLRVFAAASVLARDGDSLGIALSAVSPVRLRSNRLVILEQGASIARFAVDGMTAAQLAIERAPDGLLLAGSQRRLVVRLRVPANGYEEDRLDRLNLVNLGSAAAGLDLEGLDAWVDDGDGQLDTLADQRVGRLYFTGNRWELTGLATAVPVTGLDLLVTADLALGARDGRTVRLAVPGPSDVGLGMKSGNSGPIDADLETALEQVIGGGERVLVSATPLADGVVSPGAEAVPLLRLVFTNSYSQPRRLRSIVVSNGTTGPGTQAQLDAEFSRVMLQADSSHVVGPGLRRLPIAVGSFQNGRVTFGGLDLVVAPGSELSLLVSGDVALAAAVDDERLAASLSRAQDIAFDSVTTIAGVWPASSGAVWTVDGFVSAQATLRQRAGLTLAPADGPVTALDVRLPCNGYLADVLHGVRVTDLGNADPGEIGELRLFRDGGDDSFGGAPSDDVDLGPLVRIGSQWQSPYLSEAIPVGGSRFFVGLTVAGTTSDSSLVRLAIPAGGVEMESGNDGPLDAAIANAEPHLLSTRPLLASLELSPASSTVGQQVDLRMLVRNVGTEALQTVTPGALAAEGSASYQVTAGPTPGTLRLAPGESATFAWTVTPTAAGELRFAATVIGTGEVSDLERRALVARSNLHTVYLESDSVRLVSLQSMPSAVNLGQAGVVPLTLTLEHPGDASSSDIRFRRLRVRLEQENGAPIVPAQLASAIEVREGTSVYLRRTSLETSGDQLDLTLATPVTLQPGDPVSLALRLDIAGSTAVSAFRIVIDDSSSFVAEDAISGRPVRVRLQGQPYPIRSGLARLLAGGGALSLTAPVPTVRRVSSGQASVPIAAWQVAHSSALPSSADLRLNSIVVRASAAGGVPTPAPWTRWRVVANGLVVCQHAASAADTGDVRLDLLPAPIVQPGAVVALRVESDLTSGSAGSQFVVNAVRTSEWEVRDVNAGELAPVIASAPVGGDTIRIEAPATDLSVSPVARMPGTVAAGRARLPVLDLVLRHPGTASVAAIRVDTLRVKLHAPDGRELSMDQYVAAVRLTRRGITLDARSNPSGSEASLVVARALDGATRDTLTVEIDLAADALTGTIELRVASGAIRACDVNTGVPVAVTPEPPAGWPFGSGAATLVAPARELTVSARSELPALVPRSGASPVPVATLVLHHPGPAGAGSIAVDHLEVSAADANGASIPMGGIASSFELRSSGAILAQSATLPTDATTATLGFSAPVDIAPNDSAVFELSFRPRAADPASRFRLGWLAAGIGVVQPTSALLAVAVLPAPGSSFPMWTDVASFAANGLGESYTNFPNPFAAGRDATTFAFLMPGPGQATLRIWTPRGDPVATLLEAASLPAGLRQSDRWDGRNGRGDVVANGVYVAELDVRLDDGHRERLLRKVAVVR